MNPFASFTHAYGPAADLQSLVVAAGGEDRSTCIDAIRELRSRVFHQGALYPATGPALAALAADLRPGRGDPNVVACMLMLDVRRAIGSRLPAAAAARSAAEPSAVQRCAIAFDDMVPALLALRESDDILEQCWAIHLLAWLPGAPESLAAEELARLATTEHPMLSMTSAIVAGGRPALLPKLDEVLASWLEGSEARAMAGAMVWVELHGDPQQPDRVPDRVVDVLVACTEGEPWGEWQGCPHAGEGFWADLATLLVRCGYARAARTVPAVERVLDRARPHEIGIVGPRLLQLLYQSSPYPGAPTLEGLTELQREALERLARHPTAWRNPLHLAPSLADLDLPLDPRAMLSFLGRDETDAATPTIGVRRVDDGVVTLDTELSPAEILERLDD